MQLPATHYFGLDQTHYFGLMHGMQALGAYWLLIALAIIVLGTAGIVRYRRVPG